MLFGVCGDPEMAKTAGRVGYDYAEWRVGSVLCPREDDEAFRMSLDATRSVDIPIPALNCFVPGDLKITGPSVDIDALHDYVTTCMQRAERAGVETIVFGSGGARSVPEGFDRERAHEQLVTFARMSASIAREHGVTVAVEPLSEQGSNVLNTVAECGELVREVGHPACRLLVDAYHHMKMGDSYEDIVEYGDLLVHLHIATMPNRRAPGAEQTDFTPFFEALSEAGYDGRISIEGEVPDPEDDLPRALEVMRSYI